MNLMQWLMLARLMISECDWRPAVLVLATMFVSPVFLSTVSNVEVRTVAVSGAHLVPRLHAALENAGFATRDAEPGEATDARRGLVVLKVREDGPVRRLVGIDSMMSVTVLTYDGTSRIIRAVAAAAAGYRNDIARQAGLAPEAMDPIVVDDLQEFRLLGISESPTRGQGSTYVSGLMRRSSLVALAVGGSAAMGTCLSILVFGRRSGKLQALVCVPVTPQGHAWAIMAAAAFMGGLTLACTCAVIAVGLLWVGVEVPAKLGILPPLGAFYSATLVSFACVGASYFKNAKLAALCAAFVTLPVIASAYVPFVASLAGCESQWLHAVPFEGMTLWTVGSEVQALPAALSLVATLTVMALGHWLASKRLDSRLYLGHDH